MTFKKYLLKNSDCILEQAIAMKGDWEEEIDQISTKTEMMKLKWKLVDTITILKLGKKFEFRKLNNSLEFVLGYWSTETLSTKLGYETKPVFETIFKIVLTRYKSIGHKLKYKKLVNVDAVITLNSYTNNGIATTIYKYLVNELDYNILGDEEQYFGARKLWARLSKELDVQVDIIDAKNKEHVTRNIKLHHGNYDKDFDKALWSYNDDNNKKNLRSVLTKI